MDLFPGGWALRAPAGKDAHKDAAWRRDDVLALIILCLGVTLFHARGLRPGQTFVPVDMANNLLPWRSGLPRPLQNPLIGDPLYEFYPFLVHAINAVRRGGWPLWNPYLFLGHPTVADPLAQPFYPAFIGLGLLFGVARGLAIGLWLHALLAAVLTYGFLRSIRCQPRAAVLGAFTYALGGYMVTWFEARHRTSTLSWLPGILWAFELAVQRRSLGYTALAALMMGLAVLGGQFQFVVTFGLFLGLYALGRMAASYRHGGGVSIWPLVALLATEGLGVLLGAIQLVPFVEFLSLSGRVQSRGMDDPLPWRQLITLIIPNFYGSPTSVGSYRGALNFCEDTIYASLPALLLACTAPFCSRRPFTFYTSLVTAAAGYFIVGGPGVRMVGTLPMFRYATLYRSTFLLPLLIALLAAVTLSEPRTPSGAAVTGVGLLLAAAVSVAIYLNWGQAQAHWPALRRPVLRAAVLLGIAVTLLLLRRLPRARHWIDWGLVGLVFVDVFSFGNRFNPVGPIAELAPPTPVIEYLRAHAGLHRAVAYQIGDLIFGPNILSIFGIAEGGGYSSLIPARFHQLVAAGDPELKAMWANTKNPNVVLFIHPSRRLLDLLQVAYVVSPTPLADPGVRAEVLTDGCGNDTGEITRGHPISGTFRVRDVAINRLDLRFRVYRPGQADGTLIIRMWRGAGRERLVLDSRQDAGELADRQNLTLYFAPEREAPGRAYVWEVSAPEADHTGVGLCALADGRPAIAVYGADWAQVYQGEVYVFERLAPLPRAYVVYAAEYIPDDTQALSRLLDASFDLRNTAVVPVPLDLPAQADIPATPAEIIAYQDTRVVIEASAAQRGLLILGDQFHPGWKAYLDGQPTAVLRVNHVVRGVVLPPGEHQVVFRFAPASLRTGGLLSLGGLVGLIALAAAERYPRVAEWLRRRRPPLDEAEPAPPDGGGRATVYKRTTIQRGEQGKEKREKD